MARRQFTLTDRATSHTTHVPFLHAVLVQADTIFKGVEGHNRARVPHAQLLFRLMPTGHCWPTVITVCLHVMQHIPFQTGSV